MTVRLAAAALAVALGALAARAQDHPFKNVKVDDYATYKVSVSVGMLKLDGTTTQTVVKKDDKEATVRVVANFSGMDTPPQEQKIDLTRPYDPTKITDPQNRSVTLSYDSKGNPKTLTNGLAAQNTATTNYNPDGTVSSDTDPRGNTTTYGYSTNGNLQTVTNPGPLGAESASYDGLSRVQTSTDGNNKRCEKYE